MKKKKQNLPKTCWAVSLREGSVDSIPLIKSLADSEMRSQGSNGNFKEAALTASKIRDLVFPQKGGVPLNRM